MVDRISLEGHKRKYIYCDNKKEILEAIRTAPHLQQRGALVTGLQQKVKQFLIHWLENIQKSIMKFDCKFWDEIHPFTPKQAQQFLGAMARQHLKALYAFVLASGMRLCELLGLKMKYLLEAL